LLEKLMFPLRFASVVALLGIVRRFPEFFQTTRCPPAALLLYGPPGTGKTMFCKAVASSLRESGLATPIWFRPSCRGTTEGCVRQLFEFARASAPSLIILDNFEEFTSDRPRGFRVITELLYGLDACGSDVKVLAATYCPWEINLAVHKRFCTRIHITLPGLGARRRIFEHGLEQANGLLHSIQDPDLDELALKSEGMSGADISSVLRGAMMAPIRRFVSQFPDGKPPPDLSLEDVHLTAVSVEDFDAELRGTPASVSPGDLRYTTYCQDYGRPIECTEVEDLEEVAWMDDMSGGLTKAAR